MSVEATARQPQPLFMSGNEAVAWGARLARPPCDCRLSITRRPWSLNACRWVAREN